MFSSFFSKFGKLQSLGVFCTSSHLNVIPQVHDAVGMPSVGGGLDRNNGGKNIFKELPQTFFLNLDFILESG